MSFFESTRPVNDMPDQPNEKGGADVPGRTSAPL